MVQKVIKIGSSLGVTIPKNQVKDLNIVQGDEIEFDIRKKTSKTDRHQKLLKDLEGFMNTYDQDLKNLAKR